MTQERACVLKGRRERARGIVVPAEIVYLPSYLPGALLLSEGFGFTANEGEGQSSPASPSTHAQPPAVHTPHKAACSS